MAEVESINGNPIVADIASESITPVVDAWLTAHPETTTTVQDGAITTEKLADGAVTDAKLAQTGGVLSALYDITGIGNLVKDASVIDGQGINVSGDIVIGSALYCLDGISVVEGETYRLQLESTTSSSTTIRIHGYDSSDSWVSQLLAKTYTTPTVEEVAIVIPSGVKSVKISAVKSQGYVNYIYRNETLQEQVSVVSNAVKSIETTTSYLSELVSGTRATNVNVGETVSTAITSNTSWRTAIIPVKVGDTVYLEGQGGEGARLWAVTDSSYVLIEKSAANVTEKRTLHIDADGYVIVNMLASANKTLNLTRILVYDVIDDAIDGLKTMELTDWAYGNIACAGTIGQVFTGTQYAYSASWRCMLLRVKAGETYNVTARGSSGARAYCVFNDSHEVMEVASSNASVKDYTINVSADGYMIVNAQSAYDYKLTQIVEKDDSTTFENSPLLEVFEKVSSVTYDSSTLYTYAEIINGYDALVTAYPDNVTKTELGMDASNTYAVYKYEFTPSLPSLIGYQTGMGAKFATTDFPIVFMDACIHGNEPPCARALLNLMTKIYASDDADIFSWLKDHIKFVIIPVANPYGYVNNTRGNANGVDLNRNFPIFWTNGSSSAGDSYRGTAPLSEVEAQYIDGVIQGIKDKPAFYYSWHTHGVWTSYEYMTCYSYPLIGDTHIFQKVANDLIPMLTESGHANHELPTNSGFIGLSQVNIQAGTSANYASCYGIDAVCPEVMYKYYDGSYGIDYSTKVNCLNVEYMLLAVTLGYKYFIE